MDKKTLREEILKKRDLMTEEDKDLKSSQITELLISSSLWKNAEAIMSYINFNSEVKTKSLINYALSNEKRIIVPISIPATRQLLLSELKDFDKELFSSTYGILEPKKEFIREVEPSLIDLVIVPGVAFDTTGYRVGYGGGYYDRFHKRLDSSVPKVAIAYELQIVDKVTPGIYDIPVDYIITENRIIECKKVS